MPKFETNIKVTHIEPNNIYPNSTECLVIELEDCLGTVTSRESYSYKLSEGPSGRQKFVKETLNSIAETLSKTY